MQHPTTLYTEPQISPVDHDMSKKWYVWFRFYDTAEEKWVQRRFKRDLNTFPTLKKRLAAANDLRSVIHDELKSGWNPLLTEEEESRTVIRIYSIKDAVTYILNIKSATLRKKSKSNYDYIMKLFQEWLRARHLENSNVSKFTPALAQQYMDWLLIMKGYSGRTFNSHLVILRTFFNCFVERDWMNKNPFQAVKRKPQMVGRNHAFTEKERAALIDHFKANDIRMYYYTQVMFHCFIRQLELTSLRVRHVDTVNFSITIPGENAKNNHQESVVIPPDLEPIIKAMELHKYSPDDFLFGHGMMTGPDKYKSVNGFSERHNKVVKKLAISSEKGLYSWKHSGVCHYYYRLNKDIYALMRQLRHRELSTTQIYLKSMGMVQNDAFRNVRVA
jgi:site-specific recombinase XerD